MENKDVTTLESFVRDALTTSTQQDRIDDTVKKLKAQDFNIITLKGELEAFVSGQSFSNLSQGICRALKDHYDSIYHSAELKIYYREATDGFPIKMISLKTKKDSRKVIEFVGAKLKHLDIKALYYYFIGDAIPSSTRIDELKIYEIFASRSKFDLPPVLLDSKEIPSKEAAEPFSKYKEMKIHSWGKTIQIHEFDSVEEGIKEFFNQRRQDIFGSRKFDDEQILKILLFFMSVIYGFDIPQKDIVTDSFVSKYADLI